jgi:predicted PolB exonuclease-like 3'-5' exonuclease
MPMVIDIETVPQAKLPTPLAEIYLPKIDSKLTDPVKIEAAEKELEKKTIKAMSLDPDLGKIVAIGAMDVDKWGKPVGEPISFCGDNEFDILFNFWNMTRKRNPGFHTIGFNTISFDIPFIFRRSLYNKIQVPVQMTLRRYSYTPHFDILQTICDWDSRKFKSLDFYAEAFGFTNRKSAHGSDVYELYMGGKFDVISEYVIQDCRVEHEFYNLLRDYYPIGYPTKFDLKGGY